MGRERGGPPGHQGGATIQGAESEGAKGESHGAGYQGRSGGRSQAHAAETSLRRRAQEGHRVGGATSHEGVASRAAQWVEPQTLSGWAQASRGRAELHAEGAERYPPEGGASGARGLGGPGAAPGHNGSSGRLSASATLFAAAARRLTEPSLA